MGRVRSTTTWCSACWSVTWMRSACRANRLMAGVQWSAKPPASTSGPRAASPRASGTATSISSSPLAAERLPEPGQLHEAEALREGEVLVQQPVAAEGTAPVREQRLVGGEPHGLDGRSPEPLEPRHRPGRGGHEHAEAAAVDQLVELEGRLVAPGQKEVQAVEGDLGEGEPGAARRRRRRTPRTGSASGQRVERKIRRLRDVAGLGDLDRPQGHVVSGPELAGRHLAPGHLPPQHAAARHREARGQRGLDSWWARTGRWPWPAWGRRSAGRRSPAGAG